MSVEAFLVAWAVVAVVIAAVGVLLATRNGRVGFIGVIVDGRGRCSLTKLQLTLWSVILISLFASTAWQRGQTAGFAAALDFSIPSELLGVLGISLGSAAAARAGSLRGMDFMLTGYWFGGRQDGKPFFSQVFMEEEASDLARPVEQLPRFSEQFVTLLLISHAGYVAGKIPTRPGVPAKGLTLDGKPHPLDSSLNE
jgi:hypothetical protein